MIGATVPIMVLPLVSLVIRTSSQSEESRLGRHANTEIRIVGASFAIAPVWRLPRRLRAILQKPANAICARKQYLYNFPAVGIFHRQAVECGVRENVEVKLLWRPP